MKNKNISIVYYKDEAIFIRAESVWVLLYFYAKKEDWNGKNLNSDFRSDCGSNRRNFKGGLNYGRKEITKRKNSIRKKDCENKEEMIMAASVENMFYVRETPWHGLGKRVNEALNSKAALTEAGLDWNVIQEPIYTETKELIEGYKANVRDTDRQVLGVVTDRYKIVQNQEAFAFTDELLGEGVRYETVGSLQGGRKVWLLAHLPHEYIISGERISPYLVFFNSHDGSGAIKAAITPIRVVCQNTLNLALSTAKRSWSMIHTGDIKGKMQEAKDTLFMAEKYMDNLGKEFETLRKKKLTDQQVLEYIEILLPLEEESTPQQIRNMKRLREDMKMRYFDAPDLKDVGKNAYAFVNAVSDFATHAEPLRRTANYKENLFARTVEGNPLIDKAYQIMKAA